MAAAAAPAMTAASTPAVTTAAAAPPAMAAAATTAAFTAAAPTALGESHICRAKCNPQRADTGGKSQDDKPGGKLFADRIHESSPGKTFPLAHRQRDCDARVPLLRNCDAALHR
jgi:hypothetical protein